MDHTTHEMGHAAHRHSGAQPEHAMAGAPASHDRHAGHSVAMFRDKFWLSFALTIPVVFWSSDVQHWLGYRAPSAPNSSRPSSERSSSSMAASSSSAAPGASLPIAGQA